MFRRTLQFRYDAAKNNRELLLDLITNAPSSLRYASDALLNDIAFLLQAMNVNGLAIKGVNRNLPEFRKILLTAVTQNGHALKWLEPEDDLLYDVEIVRAAINQDASAIKWAKKEIFENNDFLLELRNNDDLIRWIKDSNDEYLCGLFLYQAPILK